MTAPEERCSTLARSLAEPLAGTAPLATTWLAVEQEGPWGNRALTGSHLDPVVGARLEALAEGTGVTVVLIRRPGHHADRPGAPQGGAGPRSVWISHVGADPWLVRAEVADPAELFSLDFAALGAGRRPDLGADDPDRLLLVCTNSRRDECCALIGRPLAQTLATEHPGRVWESSHLGGHRLAPVVLSLPDGFVHGGVDAGRLGVASGRGRSALSRPAQAAELAALRELSEQRPRPLTVTASPSGWRVADPRSGFQAEYAVAELPREPVRKESCVKDPVSSVVYTVERMGA